MRIRKILLLIIPAVIMLSRFTVPASAQKIDVGGSTVLPMYEMAKDPYSILDLFGKSATCTSNASGSNVIHITLNQTLEKLNGNSWCAVNGASWTESVNSNTISVCNSKSDLDSGTYHLKTVFTFTDKNGKTETVTVYSSEKTVT